ncbi:MAG: hypothetical protein K0U68_04410 [Gammaproteobacteria bacterium]|nr:hypothetical protein [Gammaproteobacteria bacterium]
MAVLFCYYALSIVVAEPRKPDPDGCLTCHSLPGLQWIDEQGMWRVATINQDHYYSSLHGSVPCRDCHRKITDYPHKVENGYVDCSESCHVEEPSEGEAFTHKPMMEEYDESAHGQGWYKDFAGGNRLKELDESRSPSCRFCHDNAAYIAADKAELFKESFAHSDMECGKCHVGEVWMTQMGGHILRRFIGNRMNKNDSNAICLDCHNDPEFLKDIELEDPDSGEKHQPDNRWLNAGESYQRMLHSRLLVVGVEDGASCIDCHAPNGLHHKILRDEDEASTTHPDNLPETCSASGCHGYSKIPENHDFTMTDMHDVDLLSMSLLTSKELQEHLDSIWSKLSILILPIIIIMTIGSVIWAFTGKNRGLIMAILGGEHFQVYMAGKKPSAKKGAKSGKETKRAPRQRTSTTSRPTNNKPPADATSENPPKNPEPDPSTGSKQHAENSSESSEPQENPTDTQGSDNA